jgi:lysophospholipase L1-like esterase
MNHTIFIGDSILAGTQSTITAPSNKCSHVLTATGNVFVHDLSVGGTQVTRRSGFPKTALSGGLKDKSIVVKDIVADSVIVWQGANDLTSGVNIPTIIKDFRFFANFMMMQTHIPKTVILIGHPTTTDLRPNAAAFDTALQALVLELHNKFLENRYTSDIKYISGLSISDASNAAYMADGAHRSDAGHANMAANIKSQMNAFGFWV